MSGRLMSGRYDWDGWTPEAHEPTLDDRLAKVRETLAKADAAEATALRAHRDESAAAALFVVLLGQLRSDVTALVGIFPDDEPF